MGVNRAIVKYSLSGKYLGEYPSVTAAAEANRTYRASVRLVASKKDKQLHGMVYRYKGDPYHGEYHGKVRTRKKMNQYTLEGDLIQTYSGASEASKKTGIPIGSIYKSATRSSMIGIGFVWRFEGESYNGEYVGKVKNNVRAIVQYTLEGKRVAEFESISHAWRVTGIAMTSISKSAHKEIPVSSGFVWRFKGDSYKGELKDYKIGNPVSQFTLKGKYIRTFPTITEASKATGVSISAICFIVNGITKYPRDFIWKTASARERATIKLLTKKNYRRSKPKRGKTIFQYSLEGKLLDKYESISKASKVNKCSISAISVALDRKGSVAIGSYWRTK